MALTLLIDSSGGETRIAILRENRLQEIKIARDDHPPLVGNIYAGRVEGVVPGIAAAFVDIGERKAGFLSARDARAPAAGESGGREPINSLVHEGQVLAVRVTAEPVGDKGARLSAAIAIPGRFLVYRPWADGSTISRRITGEDERRRLHDLAADAAGGDGGGFIVRTAAEGADSAAVGAEAARLVERWREIEDAVGQAGKPCCLYREPGPVELALREWAANGDATIVIDGADGLADARRYAEEQAPGLADRIERHTGDRSLFEEYGVEAEIEAALNPRVELPGGGWIMIEPTEALTAVDVNAGSRIEGRGREEAARRVNIAAVGEIARQLRLRNIGGLIFVDVITMDEDASWDHVIDELERHVGYDRAATRVSGVTEFGVIEMTRRRAGPSLADALLEACPSCHGEGRRKSAATVGHEILRRVALEADRGPSGLAVSAAPEIADWLTGGDGEGRLAALAARLGLAVTVEPDHERCRDNFEVSTPAD